MLCACLQANVNFQYNLKTNPEPNSLIFYENQSSIYVFIGVGSNVCFYPLRSLRKLTKFYILITGHGIMQILITMATYLANQ